MTEQPKNIDVMDGLRVEQRWTDSGAVYKVFVYHDENGDEVEIGKVIVWYDAELNVLDSIVWWREGDDGSIGTMPGGYNLIHSVVILLNGFLNTRYPREVNYA